MAALSSEDFMQMIKQQLQQLSVSTNVEKINNAPTTVANLNFFDDDDEPPIVQCLQPEPHYTPLHFEPVQQVLQQQSEAAHQQQLYDINLILNETNINNTTTNGLSSSFCSEDISCDGVVTISGEYDSNSKNTISIDNNNNQNTFNPLDQPSNVRIVPDSEILLNDKDNILLDYQQEPQQEEYQQEEYQQEEYLQEEYQEEEYQQEEYQQEEYQQEEYQQRGLRKLRQRRRRPDARPYIRLPPNPTQEIIDIKVGKFIEDTLDDRMRRYSKQSPWMDEKTTRIMMRKDMLLGVINTIKSFPRKHHIYVDFSKINNITGTSGRGTSSKQ